jgi:hypothetical protein
LEGGAVGIGDFSAAGRRRSQYSFAQKSTVCFSVARQHSLSHTDLISLPDPNLQKQREVMFWELYG